MVAALIGGHCQLLPVMVAVALVFLLGIGRRSCSVFRVRRSHRSEVSTFAGVAVMVAVALVGVVMSEGAPWLFLLRPSIDTAVMVAALIARRFPPLQVSP